MTNEKPDLAALFGATPADTFLGLPKCNDLEQLDASSVFIGAPGATPYGSVGSYCKNAPKALRESIASLSANIDRYNFDLGGATFPEGTRRAADYGDLSLDEENSSNNRTGIYNAVADVVAKNSVPIVCLLYTSPSPRDGLLSRMPSSA